MFKFRAMKLKTDLQVIKIYLIFLFVTLIILLIAQSLLL
ncbi:hypothetical protein RPMD05_53 [Rhodobacteraceae phage LS06-2018-MD05]|nr:hypothetical protein RPMD05_53 [Rhodobacteraceae phage LS06-2018-MD05]